MVRISKVKYATTDGAKMNLMDIIEKCLPGARESIEVIGYDLVYELSQRYIGEFRYNAMGQDIVITKSDPDLRPGQEEVIFIVATRSE